MTSPAVPPGAGLRSGEAARGSDAWVADRSAELTALAAALTDSTEAAAALLGAALTRRPVRGVGGQSSPREAARAALMATYLGRSTTWAPPATDPALAPEDAPGQLPEDSADPDVAEPSHPAALDFPVLSRLQRAVWALREVEQLTRAEIASILDRPSAEVSRALDEAYAALGPDTALDLLRRRAVLAPALPDVRRAVLRARRHRARRTGRKRGLVIVGVLVLAAVVAIPAFVIPRLPVFVRKPGEWTYMHAVTPPKGWTVEAHLLSDTYEGTYLNRRYGGAITCWVYVDLAPEPAVETGPTTAVRINGRPGVYAPDALGGATLFWTVDEGVRARASCNPQTGEDMGDAGRANLVLVAESVRFERTPTTLPFTLTPVSDRYRVRSVTDASDGTATVGLTALDPTPDDVDMIVSYSDGAGTDPVVNPLTVQVGGLDAVLSLDPDQPELCFAPPTASAPATVCVTAYWPTSRGQRTSVVPAAVLALMTATAESLTFAADPSDRRTWVDARDAIPR